MTSQPIRKNMSINYRSTVKKGRELKLKQNRLLSNLKKNRIFSEFFHIEPKIDFSLGLPSPCVYECEEKMLAGESFILCQECAKRC